MKYTAALVLGLVLFVALPFPYWNSSFLAGNGVLPSRSIVVPQYYDEAATWLNRQTDDFGVFPVPFSISGSAVYWWNNGSDGYSGTAPSLLLFEKKTIVGSQAAIEIAHSLSQAELLNASVLSLLNVKYVMVNLDTNWNYIQGNPNWISPPQGKILSYLDRVVGLRLERQFGTLLFYRNTYWKPLELFASLIPACRSLSFEMLSIGETTRQSIRFTEFPSVVRVHLRFEPGMQTDFRDLRFTYQDRDQIEHVIPYWMSAIFPRRFADVLLRLSDHEDSTAMFEYYGSSLATNASDVRVLLESLAATQLGNSSAGYSQYELGPPENLDLTSNLIELRVVRNGPTSYSVSANGENYTLVLQERYSTMWKLKDGNETSSPSCAALGLFSAWKLDHPLLGAEVSFSPDQTFQYALYINLSGFASAVGLIIWSYAKDKLKAANRGHRRITY